MKTIIFNSTKGGCGKSTLSILTINTLVKAGHKVLALDMDTINAFGVSDFLVIPAIPELFNHQAIRYLIPKVADLELPNLDVNIILNQFNRPRSENQETFSNQILSLFTDDDILGGLVSPRKISYSNHFRKYSSSKEFRFNSQYEKQRGEALSFVNGLLGLSIDVEEV